ncbi:MAG: T9SS type A sorting domain-containing protein [Candidatus Neomarinimicrobiota bacterium]
MEPIVLLKDKFQIRIIFIIMNIYDENPEFSPDGEKIIWNTAAGGNPGEGEELWLMNADGSNKVRLTYFTDPSHEEYDPNARQITESAWSPDGKKIVFGHVSQEERGGIHIPSTLYLLTFEPTGVVTDTEIPTGFALLQNDPNPFNPTTTIRFSLPHRSHVTLKVFDVLGKEAATLVDDEFNLGEHFVVYNPKGLPSGVYFYRLTARQTEDGQAGGFIETKKMLITK